MHRLTSLCVRFPRLTVAVALALVALSVRPILGTGVAVGMDATLGADHPAVRRFEAFLERFGGGHPVLIAYECGAASDCQGALDPSALEMAHGLSRSLEQSPFVSRVDSPATASLLVASDDLGIEARRLVLDGEPSRDPRLLELALEDDLWSRSLISADGRVGAIVVELASTESAALFSVVEEISRALGPHEQAGFRFHQVGEPAMWVAAHEDAVASMSRSRHRWNAVPDAPAPAALAAGADRQPRDRRRRRGPDARDAPAAGLGVQPADRGRGNRDPRDRLRQLRPFRGSPSRGALALPGRGVRARRHEPLDPRPLLPDHRHHSGLVRRARERRPLAETSPAARPRSSPPRAWSSAP
jgi:hypothetical protein